MLNKKLDLKRLLFSMSSLVDLGQEATSSKDLSAKMKAALYVITGMFSVPTAALFVYNPQRKILRLFVEKGRRARERRVKGIPLLPEHIKRFRMNDPHTFRDMAESAFFVRNKEVFSDLQTTIFLPLFAKGDFVGAIALGRKLGRAPFRQGEKDVLRVIAHQMAITLHNARLFLEVAKKAAENKKLYSSMQQIYQDTIQAFATAIDAKDEYTKDHSYRVASYAVAIARELGWKKKDVEGIYIAGLLHDIGKIIIDVKVINKGATLSTPELTEIRKHPQISYDILSKIRFPWKNIENFVRHHHERLDGKGYPDSLKEAELSDGVKILALVDAFDAMTSDRPYRDKLPVSEALKEVTRCKGTQFDTKITNTFFNVLRKELNGEVKEPHILPHLHNLDMHKFKALSSNSDT
ncbi:MAG: HD domain-containing protein [Nitrospirae bacterium]|nr:HD domain-containing protein [Nitrospirota bacterium]NTW65207.1 HD domain-containing protein [Nitrospirota bacterium]